MLKKLFKQFSKVLSVSMLTQFWKEENKLTNVFKRWIAPFYQYLLDISDIYHKSSSLTYALYWIKLRMAHG